MSIKQAIDSFLSAGSAGVPTYDDMVSIFVKNKFGIDKLREDTTISKEEIDEEEQSIIEYYTKGDGRKPLEAKYNELKVLLSQAKSQAQKLPSAISSAIATVVLPSTIGVGAPNLIKEAVNLNTSKNQILSSIDLFLGAISKLLGLADELGLTEIAAIKAIESIAAPIVSAKSKIESQPTQESGEETNPETQSEGILIDENQNTSQLTSSSVTNSNIFRSQINDSGLLGIN